MSANSKADTQTVLNLKEALEKELPVSSDDPASVERVKDVLERLNECPMTLEILTETLIGAVVNKLKGHTELGALAKGLVKKWKKLVKKNNNTNDQAATKVKSETKPNNDKNTTTVERRESLESTSGSGEAYDPESEWAGLSNQRHSICQKLYAILLAAKPELLKQGVNEAAILHLTAPRTAEIEQAIHAAFVNNSKGYSDKARSIVFNLKKNKPLAVELLLGQIEPAELVTFTAEQLAAPDIRQKRQETAKKLIDSKRLDWDQANEDKINKMCGIKGDLLQASLFTCGRCKSIKTTSTQKQTRSADEPMTVFVLCLNCGKRWKC